MSDEPSGRIIPCGPLIASVTLGDGAQMTVINPCSFADGGLQWRLRYGDAQSVALLAAGVVEDYDALTSGELTIKETLRRLRILRRARAQLLRETT
jgi:hypothetical protein